MTSEIPFKDIRVLSFDIYGTLIDWETGIYEGLRTSPLGPYLPSGRQQTLEEFEDIERAVQRENPTQRQSAANAEVVRRYARQLGLVPDRLSEQQVDEAAVEFGRSIGAWPAFPDTVAAIQKLQQRYKLVPLSNIDRASFASSLAGPLKGCRFDAVYTAEDIGRFRLRISVGRCRTRLNARRTTGSYKPNPRNFEYLIEHVKEDFGVDREQLCHVAQSLFHDHAPAKPFGLSSVWVDRKGHMGARAAGQSQAASEQEYGYKLRVESLGELAEIVDQSYKAE